MIPPRSPLVAILSLALLSCPTAPAPPSPAVVVAPKLPLAPPVKTRMDDDHAQGIAANPPGIRYEVRFADARSRFVQGEPIRLELSFSSSLPATYQLDAGLYDRIGRLSLDEYVLEPDDAVDPLADYFEHGIGGMGGLRQMPVLGDKPEKMTFELNEWKRFDRPGHYRLYVRSARIQRDAGDNPHDHRVTSNLLELDVDPASKEWQARALAEATALIDGSAGEDDKLRGARALRFLGTEAAALEMVRRLRGDYRFDYQYEFGLIGSPHRAAIVQAMEAKLDDDAPVTQTFVSTLALLRDKLDHPGPVDRARRGAVTDAYAARLAAALTKKPPASRAVCVATVLELGWQRQEAPPPYVAGALALIPGVFRDLPPDLMSRLLDSRWARIKGPAMLPVLRALYDDPATKPDFRESALRRLVALDPAGARERILAQIRTGEPLLGVLAQRTLAALPDATLPELDAPLVRRLERSPDKGIVALIARYATAAPLKAIRDAYAKHAQQWDSDIEGHFLGYFLRVDPAYAERAARALYAGALSTNPRDPSRTLGIAAGYRMTPGLEQVLIGALDAPRASIVQGAAEALRKHGSAAAAPALWRRLERFHAEWKDREAELRYSVVDSQRNADARGMEQTLWSALATGKGWLCDKAAFARLGSLLVSPQEKQQAGYRADRLDQPIRLEVTHSESGELRIAVAQYDFDSLPALEAKLAQFPRGTAFKWSSWSEEPTDFPRIEHTLGKLGMTVAR